MKRYTLIAALAIVLAALSGAAFGQAGGQGSAGAAGAAAFFKNRSAAELASLDRGEILVGKLADWRKMGLGATGAGPDALRSRIAKLRPNYVTEFMAVAQSDDGTLERLKAALSDVKGYVGIPYLSKKYNSVLQLFDKMIIKSRSTVAGGEAIETTQHMQPFEDFDAQYQYSLAGDELDFSCQNSSVLNYFGYSAVQAGKMNWILIARRVGDRCYFYGIGAMSVFDLFGVVRDRLETSFIGRVESFMRYMYGKVKVAK